MSQSDEWTIGRLLTWTTEFLGKHGSDSARLDAEVLLAESRGCPRIALYTAFDEVADETTRARFRELVRQRAEGKPVAYLVGRREFYSLSFRVTADVLIPRPETELLVLRAIDLVKQLSKGRPPLVADIGTGSGIVAVCLAKHLPAAQFVAVDASPAALDIAKENAATHGVAERIEFVEGDLFASVAADRQFDLVASNPPYVSEAEFAALDPTVRNFDPRQALVAGPRGTEVIERLVTQSAERLQPGGWLLMEISPMIEGAVRQIVENQAGLTLHPTIKDLAQLARVIQAQKLTA